jgi:hypothetical protein
MSFLQKFNPFRKQVSQGRYGVKEFERDIKKENDVDYLNSFLNFYIKIDRDNLLDKSNVEMHSKISGLTPQEYVEDRSKMIDKMEDIVKNRIEKLKNS